MNRSHPHQRMILGYKLLIGHLEKFKKSGKRVYSFSQQGPCSFGSHREAVLHRERHFPDACWKIEAVRVNCVPYSLSGEASAWEIEQLRRDRASQAAKKFVQGVATDNRATIQESYSVETITF